MTKGLDILLVIGLVFIIGMATDYAMWSAFFAAVCAWRAINIILDR